MNMIGRSSNAFGFSIKAVNRPSQVFVESISPVSSDNRHALFGREHEMVVQAKVRRWHFQECCRPCRDATFVGFETGDVVAQAPQSPATRYEASGFK